MALTMLETLKLLLATRGVDAATSEALLTKAGEIAADLGMLVESTIDRNRAQEIDALVTAAGTLVALAGAAPPGTSEAGKLRELATNLLDEVDALLAGGEEDDKHPLDPGIVSVPGLA